MYHILRLLILEIASRSDFIGRSGPMEFPVGPAGNNFNILGPLLAGIIKFVFIIITILFILQLS